MHRRIWTVRGKGGIFYSFAQKKRVRAEPSFPQRCERGGAGTSIVESLIAPRAFQNEGGGGFTAMSSPERSLQFEGGGNFPKKRSKYLVVEKGRAAPEVREKIPTFSISLEDSHLYADQDISFRRRIKSINLRKEKHIAEWRERRLSGRLCYSERVEEILADRT